MGLDLREELFEVEFQFQSVLDIISEVFIPMDGNDSRIWFSSMTGIFSGASSLYTIKGSGLSPSHIASLFQAPHRIPASRWMSLLRGILAMDNLWWRLL